MGRCPSAPPKYPSDEADPLFPLMRVARPMRTFLVMSRILVVLGLAFLVACGGGSPSGGNGNGPFAVTAGPNGGVISGLNVGITLSFNKSVLSSSVGPAAIQVVTVDDPSGSSTIPAGIVASVDYVVSASKIVIQPTLEFDASNVIYGFVAGALYEVSFANPFTGSALKSATGETLTNTGETYFFRTPDKAFDSQPGYPIATAFLVDDVSGVVLPAMITDDNGDGFSLDEALGHFGNPTLVKATQPPTSVPIAPVRPILVGFEDAVLPNSVLNVIDQTSPSISLLLNSVPAPGFVPKTVPVKVSLFHQQPDLTLVLIEPQYQAYPPGGFLFLEIDGTIQDLACNSKASVTGSGTPELFAQIGVVGVDPPEVDPLVELFDDKAQEDAANTSADWDGAFPGRLGPVLGGGTGADGPLVLDVNATASNPGSNVTPSEALIDFTARTLRLPVVEQVATGIFEPRAWDFTSIDIGQGWTVSVLTDRDGDGLVDPNEFLVQSAGHPLDGQGASLILRAAGDVTVFGTIDVSGDDAPTVVRPDDFLDPAYDDYFGQGGRGAEATSAAGDGGDGGDVLLLREDGTVAFALKSPAAIPPFFAADPRLRGVTGRSSILTPTSIVDPDTNLGALLDPEFNPLGDPGLFALLQAGHLRLQPNVGIGSQILGNSGTANQSIDENHPTFTVESVTVSLGVSTINVTTDKGDLDQVSGNVGTDYAPIAAAGDSYLLGRFQGFDGTDVAPLARGGAGAEPYLVVNALAITTPGGGGGGGGAVAPGGDGEDGGPESDIFVNQRSNSGGISLDESPGAQGGKGTIRGLGRAGVDTESSSTIDLVVQFQGRDLAELTGGELVGSLMLPNSDTDGWLFEITDFDGVSFTLARIQLDEIDIGLNDGPGAGGPGLIPGMDYGFTLLPSLDIGGGGGGASGASVTGTINSSPSSLPEVAPGAAGGAGGGGLVLESARNLRLGPTARLFANGGDGGVVFDPQVSSSSNGFAGGGGGGGGNIVVRAGLDLQIFLGAEVSAAGGRGGGVAGAGQGGDGGGGYIRFEDFADSLVASLLSSFTDPPLAESGVGRMFGVPQGVGQSLFYDTKLANPGFTGVTVNYSADTDDDGILEPLAWSFDENGPNGGPEGFLDPPFRIRFNSVGTDSSGFLDTSAVTTSFLPAADLVSSRSGLVWQPSLSILLYSVSTATTQLHRLDPEAGLAPALPPTIDLPILPGVGDDELDILSMTVGVDDELFLLERGTGLVHVMDLDNGLPLRTIELPSAIQGAMAFDGENLLISDNASDRLVLFRTLADPLLPDPTQDFAITTPEAVYGVIRDGLTMDIEFTGMAYDAVDQALWCVDAMQGLLLQVSLVPGFEGTSTQGSEPASRLVSGGELLVPSAVAFDGTTLYLVRATHSASAVVIEIDPDDVSLMGSDLELADPGVAVPEVTPTLISGRQFVRFNLVIDGLHEADGISFRKVRIDDVTIHFENEAF